MHVHPVGDHLAGDLVPVEQRTDGTGLAVMRRPHAVEQMGRMRGAGVDGRQRDFGGGIGVPDGDRYASPDRRLDYGDRPG